MEKKREELLKGSILKLFVKYFILIFSDYQKIYL